MWEKMKCVTCIADSCISDLPTRRRQGNTDEVLDIFELKYFLSCSSTFLHAVECNG